MNDSPSSRDESEGERLDRNLGELLQELRVALPGVQVLFGFLLAVPFQQGFADVTDFQRTTYFVTLLLTALTTALFISPTAIHRATFRMQKKNRLVQLGNRLAIVGLLTLSLAMTGAVTLMTDVLYGATTTLITSIGVFIIFAMFWAVLPTRTRSYPDD